ncbi:MAG: hypothetical protein M3542_11750 [Acidobacteriota bacterium]|nr:hypothetical protein [Acidobacteriota bacterium]MDQ5871467.1 hypothetical protein [Acidobacteriota bacterium]
MKKTSEALRLRTEFPIRERYTVSGHVVGDLCFTCECRTFELDCDEGMILAWCECGWPADAHEMEVLVAGGR